MYELTKPDVLGLQVLPVADSVVADELAGLRRKHSRRGAKGGTTNVCLITLSGSLNNLGVLTDILSLFG